MLLVKRNVLLQEIANNDSVLVDFFAKWCQPCKALMPKLEELEGKYRNVKFIKVDVDESPDLVDLFDIRSVPTVLVFKDSKEIKRFTGNQSMSAIEEALSL